jgi:cyclic-di-AMP phosphodiesterase PgpH
MSILEKLGLGPKKPESSPNIGKKKKKQQLEDKAKKNRYLRILIFFVFLSAILITLPQSTFQPVAGYSVGEPWRADDLTAPFTFSLKKTAAEVEEEREAIVRDTAPVFHVNPNAPQLIESRMDSVYRSLQPVLDSYLQWQRAKADNQSSAANDSVRFRQERNLSNIQLDNNSWNVLLENYANVQQNNLSEQRLLTVQIRNQLQDIIEELLTGGIIDRTKEGLNRDEITIRNLRQRTEQTINLANTRDISEAREYANFLLARQFAPNTARAATQLFNQVIQPNWEYNASDTEAIIDEKMENISPSKGAVEQGEIIIRRGDLVTEERANKLESLAEARAVTASEVERWLRYAGEAVVIIIAALLFLIYIYLYRKPIFQKPSMFLLVFLALGIITLASTLVYPIDSVNSYIVPIAVAPIILTIIFDSRVGLMATVTLGIITGIIHDNSFEYLVATIAACSLGVFSVRDIKKRSQFFFTTPGVVFITYVLVVSGFALARFSGWERLVEDILFISINSVFILFTYPLILLFEKLFKITTDFTLLEMADTNLPLMKELMNKAPGTFHHSLQVANLAESAASEIGANALLCRVGAMYHDIGKMEKPAYFIENQGAGNDHDKLKPRMSALVIKAHVSDGVKKAKENNLPQVLIDFITTHHGTSLIKYFYGKAKNQTESEDIEQKDFRYDGPIPFTKEQGILLLADGVEAASRAMKEPNYNKLENLINRMVEDHIQDGQLSNCPLTFRQIQIIKKSFLNILVGVYHSRIEYPDDKKEREKKEKADSGDSENISESVDDAIVKGRPL